MKSDNTVKYRYVSSVRIDDILFSVIGRKHYYYVKDQLDSVRKILDKDNRVVNSYGYKPFGGIVAEKEGVENRYLFTGRERINLGVYYYRARVYLSELRRFGKYDSIIGSTGKYKSWNLYRYVGNNPIIYLDPFGLQQTIIYYENDPNNSFQNAANTAAQQYQNNGQDVYLVGVTTENDFIEAWNNSSSDENPSSGIDVFSHGGKGELYFEPDNQYGHNNMTGEDYIFSSDGTVDSSELISLLKQHDYSQNASINLHSCNSAVNNSSGNSVASILSKSQNIRTTGTLGYSSFSENYSQYERINNQSSSVYLEAYNRSWNNPSGDGSVIPRKVFDPNSTANLYGGSSFIPSNSNSK